MFHRNRCSPLSNPNGSSQTLSHNLTAATTQSTLHPAIKAPQSPLVDQIPPPPVLIAGELATGKAAVPIRFSKDEPEFFEDECAFFAGPFHPFLKILILT